MNASGLTALDARALASEVQALKALGVEWVRYGFHWNVIQRAGRDAFDVAPVERVVQALQGAGIDILGLVAYSPPWASQGASKFHPPVVNDDYARFAGRLARHFAPRGVHAWEIWNEPNLAQFWAPRADAAAYVDLLTRAYAAIHEADAGALVVSGGLAQPVANERNIDALEFARALCVASARTRCLDAIGNHPYDSPRLPSDAMAHNWRKMSTALPVNLRSLLQQNGQPTTPIWMTEFGAPTMGKSSLRIVISEERQARMLEEGYRLVAGYAWSGPLFWYNFRDYCPPDEAKSTECFYGLLRHDGTYKPAAESFRALKSAEAR